MALAHVPAPATTSTDPKKMSASKVERVQGVRMWKTPAKAAPGHKYPLFLKDLRQQALFASPVDN
jgi:hypothetical protein